MEDLNRAICPCCGGEVIVEYRRANWIGQRDHVSITHRKWIGPLEPRNTLDKGFNIFHNRGKYIRR